MRVKCESCGEIFRSLDSHVEHGGAFTCCKRKLDKAQAEIAARDERIAELLRSLANTQSILERHAREKYQEYDRADQAEQDRDTARARVRELEAALEKVIIIADRCNDAGSEYWQAGLIAKSALASATQEPAQPDVRALERELSECDCGFSGQSKFGYHTRDCAAAQQPGAAGEE